jgi:hypothetical protein
VRLSNVLVDSRLGSAPVVILQAANVALVDRGANQAHETADHMLRNKVDSIALKYAVYVEVAALDAARVTREQKFKSVRPQEWLPALRAKPAFSTTEHVTVDDSLKRGAMRARQMPAALGTIGHNHQFC